VISDAIEFLLFFSTYTLFAIKPKNSGCYREGIRMLSLSRAITVSLCVVITGGILTSSALAQTEWTKYGRVVPDGLIGKPGEWDGIRVTEPSVLFRDGLYRIWYTGESGGYSQRIGYATSSDGIEWTKCVQNPVITPRVSGGFVYSSSVIFRNGKYEMWYVDVPRNGQPRHISYATSTNGVEWTPGNLGLQAEGGWEGSQVGYHCVIFHDEELKIWYSGFNGSIYQIGYATFKDGIDIEWNRHGPIDLEAHVILPSVIFRNGKYEMWYCNGSGGYTEIRYAISYNGVNWAKYEGNPVLVPGVSGEWDARSVSGPSVLFKDGEYKMWHTGENSEKIHSIGYATSLLPVVSAIDIDPDTLNLKSKGEWITCYIALPEDYDVHDIDVNTVFLEDVMTVQHSDIQGDVLMVKFSRQALVEYLDGTTGDVTLTVTGEVAGTPFEGTIRSRL